MQFSLFLQLLPFLFAAILLLSETFSLLFLLTNARLHTRLKCAVYAIFAFRLVYCCILMKQHWFTSTIVCLSLLRIQNRCSIRVDFFLLQRSQAHWLRIQNRCSIVLRRSGVFGSELKIGVASGSILSFAAKSGSLAVNPKLA